MNRAAHMSMRNVSRRRDATVRVLIASDGFCLGGLVSAVNSVLQHTRHDVKFYIVTTAEELPHLRKWIEATKLHKMTYELHALPALGLQHVKIRATELFPELGGRLVYLDCDVIVQGDIWELFSANIRPNHYGAFSQNCVGPAADMPQVRKPRYGAFVNLRHSDLRAPNMDKDDCPFATGVFVANLTLWRWHRVAEKMQHWLAVHRREKIVGTHTTADVVEAAMLIVLYGNVTVLDPMWHVQHLGASYNSRYSKQFIESAKLLHWSGRFKPWSHRAAHAQVWDRYYIPDPTGQFRPARKRDREGLAHR
ncbi:glycosyltransferase 8 domain-containing protein 1-like isoform X2 [Cryptotermes secundus]|uniref:glycosyltransferase 8 domain-containing protein 1-like isoform X2 n=1 Tax=Cryptotermes secundus TaxID=105785 RepID=UPI000CD7BE5E|nr:glycosyltransferase 8 domain-containing protein 1-like isoform X2 [Cryptotermes secundus]